MRFRREAEAAAKLHHTNIVPVYFTGQENRLPYYVMELIDGPSLDRVVAQLRKQRSGDDGSDAPATGRQASDSSDVDHRLTETITAAG